MFLVSYKHVDILYFDYESFFEDTFNPDITYSNILNFKISGNTYAERKENARALAVDFQCNNYKISYSELLEVQAFFKRIGRRYGLINEFKENCII